jgi:hypothetical protein
MNAKLALIVEEKSTEADRAEYRAYRAIVARWTQRLESFNKGNASLDSTRSLKIKEDSV